MARPPAADPGCRFAFRTLPDRLNRDSTTWWYDLEPHGGGTVLTHSFEIHAVPRFPVSVIFRLFLRHHGDMRPQVRARLERIRDIAERNAGTRRLTTREG